MIVLIGRLDTRGRRVVAGAPERLDDPLTQNQVDRDNKPAEHCTDRHAKSDNDPQ